MTITELRAAIEKKRDDSCFGPFAEAIDYGFNTCLEILWPCIIALNEMEEQHHSVVNEATEALSSLIERIKDK